MNDTVISVRNLGKRYRLGATLSHDTLRDTLAHAARSLLPRLRPASMSAPQPSSISASQPLSLAAPSPKEIWALRDVSFDVHRGEVVGIIGRNGAGKSTLLKILSQITEPTEGEVRMRGRVGSLLEVGTGMHPELSGRENIYLNGSILGMRKSEIDRRYDEIVDFAGIPDFMSTPIKRYSSGMRVRLGFAIAAHLEPEILIVDEVLAVGDQVFQRKCLGKMEEVAHTGRTVLFVSHNATVVENLCCRCILLDKGRAIADGLPRGTVERYSLLCAACAREPLHQRRDRSGDGRIRFSQVEVIGEGGAPRTGRPVRFRLHFELARTDAPLKDVAYSFTINTLAGDHLLAFSSSETCCSLEVIPANGSLECTLPYLPLAAGVYGINVYVTVAGVLADYVLRAVTFSVDDADYYAGAGSRHASHPTYVAEHRWSTSFAPPGAPSTPLSRHQP